MPKKVQKKSKVTKFYALFAAVVLLSAGAFFYIRQKDNVTQPTKPLSRAVLELAEEQVRITKPAPALSALQYAYVSSVYNDSLKEGGQKRALYNAKEMLKLLYPQAQFDDAFKALATDYKVAMPENTVNSDILTTYKARLNSDGHTLVWDGVIPKGQEYWYKTKEMDPFTPRAGEWKRWLVSSTITVAAPPAYGSAEDQKQLQIVQQATQNRNGQDVNDINFWGGTPGTDAPSGIWQNQIYSLIVSELPKDSEKADEKYAYIQKYAAQAMSDAFMECWKVKYTYWTARPSMRIPGLSLAMPDPYFPSYISGHSTISKAAADVLSVLVPEHADQWEAWAVTARNSRLSAGVHFETDNTNGFLVGAQVAKQAIEAAHLVKQL